MKEKAEPLLLTCQKCDYSWESRSKMYFVSCPRCGNKVKVER